MLMEQCFDVLPKDDKKIKKEEIFNIFFYEPHCHGEEESHDESLFSQKLFKAQKQFFCRVSIHRRKLSGFLFASLF
jgi:hypothetical protein